jgi:predicted sulfurtransferase
VTRCERASAFLREKGPEFEDLLQLRGEAGVRGIVV